MDADVKTLKHFESEDFIVSMDERLTLEASAGTQGRMALQNDNLRRMLMMEGDARAQSWAPAAVPGGDVEEDGNIDDAYADAHSGADAGADAGGDANNTSADAADKTEPLLKPLAFMPMSPTLSQVRNLGDIRLNFSYGRTLTAGRKKAPMLIWEYIVIALFVIVAALGFDYAGKLPK